METPPKSPFPAGSTDTHKHNIVRYAFEHWAEFPEAKSIGDVIKRLDQRRLEVAITLPLAVVDVDSVSVDAETGEVSLPDGVATAIDEHFSDPITVARRDIAVRRHAERNDSHD